MASSLDFVIGIIVYLSIVVLFVGLLSASGVLKDTGIEITNPDGVGSLVELPSQCLTPKYCYAKGKINFEDDEVFLFTYVPSSTNFTVNGTDYCALCCRNESTHSWMSGWSYGYSCQGQCLRLEMDATLFSPARNFTNCSQENVVDLSSQAKNALDVVDTIKIFTGFFLFQVNMGFSDDLVYINYIIVVVFVYLPLLCLVLAFLWWLRGI